MSIHSIRNLLVASLVPFALVTGVATADTKTAMFKGRVPMMAEPQTSAVQNPTGFADVNVAAGTVTITVTLEKGQTLPEGTVLEGWLSTAGRKGGPGMSTASEADQKFGPAFGKKDAAMTSRDIPYALSTGQLKRKGSSQMYTGSFKIANPLTPYAAVAVTLETDGNTGTYDPRPGSPFMAGMIGEAAMAKPAMADPMMAKPGMAKPAMSGTK